MASLINSPTPNVVVCIGLRFSSGTSVIPAAADISMIAVFGRVPSAFKIPYSAVTGSPRGPVTLT